MRNLLVWWLKMLRQMPLLLLLLLLVLTPASGFSQSVSRESHEVCGYDSMAEYKDRKGRRESEPFGAHREYTIYWNVNISSGRNMADAIAERHGFVNNGPV